MAVHNPLQHTTADTLAMLLPAMQLEVMRIVWADGPLSGKQVHSQIAKTRKVTYTTIMTTMVRLHEKGLLDRCQERPGYSAAYTYSATVNERTFIERSIHGMLDCVAREYPSVLTQYLDTHREYAAV